jgi:hypothetical protein
LFHNQRVSDDSMCWIPDFWDFNKNSVILCLDKFIIRGKA